MLSRIKGFAGKASQYGCQHEDGMRKFYEEIMITDHHSLNDKKLDHR